MDLSNFSPALLLVITVATSIINTWVAVRYLRRHCHNYSDHILKMALLSPGACLCFFAFMGFRFSCSPLTAILGVTFGLATSLSSIVGSRAMETGPIAYYSVISNFSTVITALSGFLFFSDDVPGAFKWIGMFFMFGCAFLSVDYRDKGTQKATWKWLFLVILSTLFSASVGLLQKVHQTNEEIKTELFSFLLVAFAAAFVFSLICFFIVRRKEVKHGTHVVADCDKNLSAWGYIKNIVLVPLVLLGIFAATVNILNLYLVGVIPTAVFFPIVNGVPLMEQMLMGFLLYKEKLTKTQIVGLLSGLAGIVFLAI